MSYRIADEPEPSGLGQYVVRPTAPLLAAMVAGAWLAWPWYAFNAIALGSPTRRREIAYCAISFGGTVVLALIALALYHRGIIVGRTQIRLALLVIASWKLGMAYAVCALQSRTFHVYQYYRGTVANPARILLAGALLRAFVLGAFDSDLWVIIVAGGT